MPKYTCKIAKRVGETSSKYGYSNGGELFEQDIAKRYERGEALYREFVDWMLSHKVTPRDIRRLFTRFYEEYFGESE